MWSCNSGYSRFMPSLASSTEQLNSFKWIRKDRIVGNRKADFSIRHISHRIGCIESGLLYSVGLKKKSIKRHGPRATWAGEYCHLKIATLQSFHKTCLVRSFTTKYSIYISQKTGFLALHKQYAVVETCALSLHIPENIYIINIAKNTYTRAPSLFNHTNYVMTYHIKLSLSLISTYTWLISESCKNTLSENSSFFYFKYCIDWIIRIQLNYRWTF